MLPVILIGVGLNAVAQLLLKAGMDRIGHFEFAWVNAWPVGVQVAGSPWVWGGLSCYAISVVIWILVLSRVDVSIAYPLLSLGYVVNAIAAYYWLGENLT